MHILVSIFDLLNRQEMIRSILEFSSWVKEPMPSLFNIQSNTRAWQRKGILWTSTIKAL